MVNYFTQGHAGVQTLQRAWMTYMDKTPIKTAHYKLQPFILLF